MHEDFSRRIHSYVDFENTQGLYVRSAVLPPIRRFRGVARLFTIFFIARLLAKIYFSKTSVTTYYKDVIK
jgi:hypothetical protein